MVPKQLGSVKSPKIGVTLGEDRWFFFYANAADVMFAYSAA